MMRIFITGGAGFVGSHIADLCIAHGHEVAVVDDLSSGRRENVPTSAKLYELDIRKSAELRAAFNDFRPTVVCHQAAQASVSISMRSPDLDADINVLGGLAVLEAAAACGSERIVFASTGGAIYGNIAEGLASETHEKNPVSPYAIHKLAYEQLLASLAPSRKIEAVVLRYSNVYGPRQDPHGEAGVVAIFSRRAISNQGLRVFGMREEGDSGCLRDYVHVSDVARANLSAIEGKLGVAVMNIATGIGTDTRRLAEHVVKAAKSSVAIESGPPRLGDVERSVLDPALFRAKFGATLSLEEGLEDTVRWFRDNP